ncbi:MAG TPA: DUF1295 domain-containing protein [candidate division Zixibacteria bacterium]|nr:DUF1295 domain-containing protein [candidate division Zixibacteria bacterium]
MVYTGLLFKDEPLFYCILILVTTGLALAIFTMLFFITAGYGRHNKKKWGAGINTHLGWFIMELPTLAIMGLCFIFSDKWLVDTGIKWTYFVFLFIWFLHYGHRVLIYPFQIRNGKKMTITIVLMGFLFNLSNVYIQGRWLFTLSDPIYTNDLLFPISNADYTSSSWLYSPQFIVGVLIFLIGYFINKKSDLILRNLRKDLSEGEYKIPSGFLYRFITAPNYLGELLEWIGWAILTWSLAGVTFVIWTFANLFPRAISHHRWYKEKFEDYPEERKAIIPFLL